MTLFRLPERTLAIGADKNKRNEKMNKLVLQRVKGIDENDKTRQIVI